MFNTLSMVVLRFKKSGPREFVVPLNIKYRGVYLPIGLGLVFLTMFLAAMANLVTKPVATTSGLCEVSTNWIFGNVWRSSVTILRCHAG